MHFKRQHIRLSDSDSATLLDSVLYKSVFLSCALAGRINGGSLVSCNVSHSVVCEHTLLFGILRNDLSRAVCVQSWN